MATEEMVPVESKCPDCKIVYNFEVPKAGLDARRKGVPLRLAFPTLDPAILVQLSTHICPDCQKKVGEKK